MTTPTVCRRLMARRYRRSIRSCTALEQFLLGKGFIIGADEFSFDSLGPWDDYVIRYEGSLSGIGWSIAVEHWTGHREEYTETYSFGVDWRNGMARPWANGMPTYHSLADSGLSGTATWVGELVGLTPAKEAVHGDSTIQVDIATVAGSAAFTALEHWGVGLPPGSAGTGTRWGDGSLRYSVELDGNYFRSTAGDEGTSPGALSARNTTEQSEFSSTLSLQRLGGLCVECVEPCPERSGQVWSKEAVGRSSRY